MLYERGCVALKSGALAGKIRYDYLHSKFYSISLHLVS
jgi:hypothetical protein